MPTRHVTLKEVAQAAGVHVSTASRALDPARSWRISPTTVERVRTAATQLGYLPHMIARGLKRGTTMTIGVVVADLENPFIGPVIRGIGGTVEQKGFVALIAETFDEHEALERILNHLIGRRVDAIITTAARMTDGTLLKHVAQQGIPVVLAVRTVPRSGLPSVAPDDRLGASLAVEHLLALGHCTLAQLRGPQDVSNFVDRGRAFELSAARAGALDVSVPEAARRIVVDEGRRLMGLMLSRSDARPTAVFAHNDLLAIGAIDAIRAAGLDCPRDVSVVGYNDAALTDHLSPSLSTVRMPHLDLGRKAAELVMELIAVPDPVPPPILVAPTLVARDSSGPAQSS